MLSFLFFGAITETENHRGRREKPPDAGKQMNRKKKVEDKSCPIQKRNEKKVASEKVILLLLSPELFPRPITWAREWGHSGRAEFPLLGPESMDEHDSYPQSCALAAVSEYNSLSDRDVYKSGVTNQKRLSIKSFAWRKFEALKKSKHNKSMQPLKSQLTPALTAASAG